jgi:hypothetical protein
MSLDETAIKAARRNVVKRFGASRFFLRTSFALDVAVEL